MNERPIQQAIQRATQRATEQATDRLAATTPAPSTTSVMAEANQLADTLPRLPQVSAPTIAPGLAATLRAVVWPGKAGLASGDWTLRWRNTLLCLATLALCVILIPIQPSASADLLAATRARAVYRYDMALADDAQAHAADASDPRPLCDAGDLYALQHEFHQAASAFRACIALTPGDGSAWLRLGDALASAHDDAGAVSAWQRAGAAGDSSGYAKLAERAEALGQLAEAARWWVAMPQDNELAQGHLGMLALAQGNVTTASAHFYPLIHSESDYAISLRNAGIYLFAAHPPTTALDEENIGIALLTVNEPTLALAPLSRAAQLAPTDGATRAYYGWTLWLLGQRDAARPQIAAGLRYSPALPFALFTAGEEEMTSGQFAQALAHFQTALVIDSKNPALWSAAGDAALAEADYVTADLSYTNAAQLSDDPAYTVALARFYLDHAIGLTDGSAEQFLVTATRRFPDSEPLAFIKGQMENALGQKQLAAYDFQRAVALDPTDPGPWFYLGIYTAANGDVIPAVVNLRTALALQPTGAYAAQARKALAPFHADTL